jgi:hypothetical protein
MWRILLVAVISAVACRSHRTASARQPTCPKDAYMPDTTAPCIAGHIVDSATGRPIARAVVAAMPWGTVADSNGAFAFWGDKPGTDTVQASRIDYAKSSQAVSVMMHRTTYVDFRLRRLPPPCCRLLGQWRVSMVLDSANPMAPRPKARRVEGYIAFGPSIPNPDPAFNIAPPDDSAPMEYGRFSIDFRPFFGGQVAPDVSRTIFGGNGPTLLKEAEGVVVTGDSLYILLIPRMTHGSIWLTGRIRGDSITGTWAQSAYCCGATGHFAMLRVSHEPPAFHEPPPPAAPVPPEDRTTWGKARVRVWEESEGRYVILGHQLHLPDGSWKSAYHTGGQLDGWGKTVELPPGEYGVVITDFPCGTKTWFLQNEFEQRFTVVTGRLTDVPLRLNLRTLPAAKSYDNPTGKLCTDRIGFDLSETS